jgi:hypothetical protein
MTIIEAFEYGIVWYLFWGVVGYLNGRWYLHRLSSAPVPGNGAARISIPPVLPFAYVLASFAPLLYVPFLDAVTRNSALFYALPAAIALSLLPTLLKLRTVNEIVERRKRGLAPRVEAAVFHARHDVPESPRRRRSL